MTNSAFDPKKAALRTVNLEAAQHLSLSRKKKLCWKCQKDKLVTGGKLIIKAGLHLFVCKDCMEAKKHD